MNYEKRNSSDDLVFFQELRDFNYPAHFHKNMEFVFCLEGEIEICISGMKLELRSGQGAVVPQHALHSFTTPKTSYLKVFMLGKNLLRDVTDVFHDKIPKRYDFPLNEALMQNLYEIQKGDVFLEKAILYQATSQALSFNSLFSRTAVFGDVASKVIAYVHENFQEPITLAQVAEHLGYNYYYTARLIKESLGQPFVELLSEYRVSFAKSLLEEGRYSISEIAMRSGFGSIRNFNRVFVEIVGVTPRAYQNR